MKNSLYHIRKRVVDTNVVNDIMHMRHSVNAHVVISFYDTYLMSAATMSLGDVSKCASEKTER